MPNVDLKFILTCDNAFFSEREKKLNIIGVFDIINTIGFPAVHPNMSIVVSCNVNAGNHEEFIIMKKNNYTFLKDGVKFNKIIEGNHQIIHNIRNLMINSEDDIVIEVYVDNKETPIGKEIIKVKKIEHA